MGVIAVVAGSAIGSFAALFTYALGAGAELAGLVWFGCDAAGLWSAGRPGR